MKLNSSFFNKTNRVFLYSSSVIFKDYKSYVYSLFLPMIVVFVILAVKTKFFYAPIDATVFPLLYLVPSIVLILFYSKVLLDWRKSTFIKQMKNFSVNKYSFILGFTLTTFLCSLMASSFGIIYISLFGMISVSGENSIDTWTKSIVSGEQIIGIILSILLASIISSSISVLFTGFLKNIYVIQTVNIVLIVFFLFFSDMLLPPQNTSTSLVICIIGYFDPYKYISWLTLMFNGKMYLNFYYVYLIVVNLDAYISFTAIWQAALGAILYIGLISYASTALFSVSTKK